jgi:hypothetical protein
MSEGEYSTKTVAQLKTILQERDLPVSGKKADLISRLIENDASSTSKTVEDNDSLEDLPFLSAVMKNGIGSVEIDRHVAIRYGSTFFMFIFIIIGLNSTSWYVYSMDSSAGGINWETGEPSGETFEMKYEYNFGLGDIEYTQTIGDDDTSSTMQYDGMLCEMGATPFDCDAFSTAGTINSLMLWLSLLSILTILGIGVAQGFGKIESGLLVEKKEMIDKVSWLLATIPLNVGTILYGLIAGNAPSGGGSGGGMPDITSGLGGMWWMMFIFSTAYICYIYRHKIMELYQKFVSNEPEASND